MEYILVDKDTNLPNILSGSETVVGSGNLVVTRTDTVSIIIVLSLLLSLKEHGFSSSGRPRPSCCFLHILS